ncbi:MAG: hypothetical protein ACLFUM_07655 [Spirochaetaceae bacterium]
MTVTELARAFFRWTRNFFDDVPAEGGADPPDPRTAHERFISAYRELAYEIASHLRYESELRASVPADAAVTKTFDPSVYAQRLIGYLNRASLLELPATQVSYLPMPLSILYPPADVRELIPIDVRRRLFNEVLHHAAVQTGEEPADVAKRYYEHVMHNDGALDDGTDSAVILELMRDALRELDVELRQTPPPRRDSSEPQPDTIDAVLSDLLRGIGIRRSRDLTALFQPGAVAGGTVTALILFVITAMLLLFGPAVGEVLHAVVQALSEAVEASTTDAERDPVITRLAPGLLGLLTAAGTIVTATRTVARSVRRRFLVRSVTAVARNLRADPETIREFFRRRFDFEWRKGG